MSLLCGVHFCRVVLPGLDYSALIELLSGLPSEHSPVQWAAVDGWDGASPQAPPALNPAPDKQVCLMLLAVLRCFCLTNHASKGFMRMQCH